MTGACALIPAAGRGVRFGGNENKAFAPLLGKPVLGWTLEAFAGSGEIEDVIIIGREADVSRLEEIAGRHGGGKVRQVVTGGETRQESVAAGLAVAQADMILIHDAARPCVTEEIISAVAAATREYGAATAAIPVADTLVQEEGHDFAGDNVPRRGLYVVQTPQGCDRMFFQSAHDMAAQTGYTGTDDAGLVRRCGLQVRLTPGSPENIKITRPEDLVVAEAILMRRHGTGGGGAAAAMTRVGFGYDVHPFAEGRKLMLGGVEFDGETRGLAGHSDADALLHAVCDALLGAAGLGDIGKHFPPSDPAHKDRPSLEFLREVRGLLEEAGYRVGNIDVTVLAESPKIGPRAAEMKAAIAGVLEITPENIGIKATTSEGMGFIGRGEGIAVHAAALIHR